MGFSDSKEWGVIFKQYNEKRDIQKKKRLFYIKSILIKVTMFYENKSKLKYSHSKVISAAAVFLIHLSDGESLIATIATYSLPFLGIYTYLSNMCLSIFAKKNTTFQSPQKNLRNQFLPHGQSWSQILGQSLEGKDPNPTTSRKIIKLLVTTADGIWILDLWPLTKKHVCHFCFLAKSGKFLKFG